MKRSLVSPLFPYRFSASASTRVMKITRVSKTERERERDGKTNSNSFVIRSLVRFVFPRQFCPTILQRYLFDLFSTCRRNVCRHIRYIPVGNRNRGVSSLSLLESLPFLADLSTAKKKRKGKERKEFRFSKATMET